MRKRIADELRFPRPVLALDVQDADPLLGHREVGADLIVGRGQFAGERIDLQSHLDFAGSRRCVADQAHLIARRARQVLLRRGDRLAVDQQADAHLAILKTGCIHQPFDGQLPLDGHGRRIGGNAGEGDVALLGRGGGLAEGEGVDGAGQRPPAGSALQGWKARTVVGSVAEDQQPAQIALAAVTLVQRIEHLAEIGALAVGLALRIVLAHVAGEPRQQHRHMVLVAKILKERLTFLHQAAQIIPARLVGELVLDGHALRIVEAREQHGRRIGLIMGRDRRPQHGQAGDEQGQQPQQNERQQPPPRHGPHIPIGPHRQHNQQQRDQRQGLQTIPRP